MKALCAIVAVAACASSCGWAVAGASAARWRERAEAAEARAAEAEAWAVTVEEEAQQWVAEARKNGTGSFFVTADMLHFLPTEWTQEDIDEVLRRCEQ